MTDSLSVIAPAGVLDNSRYRIRTNGRPFYHDWADGVPLALSRRFRLILIGLAVLVGCSLVWAVTVPIGSAFLGQGRLVAQGKNRIVDHLEGGIVEKVLVHEGDTVKAGDLLARMDVTDASVNLTNTRRQRDIDRIKLTRLLAEQNEAKSIAWPKDLSMLIEQDPHLAETAMAQRQEFQAKQREMAANREVLNQRIGNDEQLIASLTDLRKEQEKRLGETQEEVNVSDRMMAQGLTTRDRNFALKRQLASDQDEIRQTLIQIDQKRSDSNEAREQLNGMISQRSNEVADTMLKLQAEVFELTEKMRSYAAAVDRADVRAPIDGIVVEVAVNTRNQVIAPGKPLFEIFPSNVPMAVEAKVDPRYIDSVVAGQHVSVQFESRERTKSRTMIDGKVTFVSKDSGQDQRTGQYYYTVRASLDPKSVETYGDLVPGNLASVYFQLDKETFLQYLIDPYWDIGQKAFLG